MNESEQSRLLDVCDELIQNQKTLLLASRSADGNPAISYAPYVRAAGIFYIFVSHLAKHTQNLLCVPLASVLFIESETAADNLFARKRLTFDCQVMEIDRGDPVFEAILSLMTEQFGNTVAVLRGLADFHLLALKPESGQLIAGFGKAFAIDAEGRLQPHKN